MIPGCNLDFAFVYLGCLDSYGHMFGWMSDGYFEQLVRSDQALGRLLSALPEESSVLLQSDHGGHERNHGTDLPEDMTIPWIAAGPTVRASHTIQSDVSLLDTAPTLARMLGLKANSQWEGRCVDEIFI